MPFPSPGSGTAEEGEREGEGEEGEGEREGEGEGEREGEVSAKADGQFKCALGSMEKGKEGFFVKADLRACCTTLICLWFMKQMLQAGPGLKLSVSTSPQKSTQKYDKKALFLEIELKLS